MLTSILYQGAYFCAVCRRKDADVSVTNACFDRHDLTDRSCMANLLHQLFCDHQQSSRECFCAYDDGEKSAKWLAHADMVLTYAKELRIPIPMLIEMGGLFREMLVT